MPAENLDTDQAIAYLDQDTKMIKATAYFEDYLWKIVDTLGGEGSTIIGDLLTTIIEADKVEYMFALVKQLLIDTASFNSKIKTVNYTAENKEWIEARSKARIKLPSNPLHNSEVIISNGDGTSIIMDGNGNDIKYTSTSTTLPTIRQGSSFHFQFFSDNTLGESYWRAR